MQLQAMGKVLKEGGEPPTNAVKEFDPVLEKLSLDPGIRMDEIKSMILVSDAFEKYPIRVAKKGRDSLPAAKRQKLISFVSISHIFSTGCTVKVSGYNVIT